MSIFYKELFILELRYFSTGACYHARTTIRNSGDVQTAIQNFQSDNGISSGYEKGKQGMKRINYRIPFLFLFLVFQTLLFAQKSPTPAITNFDDNWKFSLGHAADPVKDFNYGIANIFSKSGKVETTAIASTFNDRNWKSISLPHDWLTELPFVKTDNTEIVTHGFKPVGSLYPATSIGWYRKHFTVAKSDSGQRFQIQFDGIFRNAHIWMNGFYLGNNQSGYLGITYDLTDYIHFDKENVLTVRVDATQFEGWFYEGAGIYRHVWLKQYDNIHFVRNDLFIHSKIRKDQPAEITVEGSVENLNLHNSEISVTTYVADREGKKNADSKGMILSLKINEQKYIKQTIKLSQPRLWSIEDPYLYRIVTVVMVNNKIADSIVTRHGIREIIFDSKKGMFLNGKPVKIKGTNNHEDHAGLGTAVPDDIIYYRVGLLKELGANAYRASHAAATPELLDACDSLGMLVVSEQRLLNSSPEYISQFERLLRRDRNHACVFLWSIGNEEWMIQESSIGKRIAQTLLAIQKRIDPYRQSTYAADLGLEFTGVNEVIPVRGFNYHHFAVSGYHARHPEQPIIGTEMGSNVTTRGIYVVDSIMGYVPDKDIISPIWSSKADSWWPLAAENLYWSGGFVWTGFDYRGESTPFGWPNINSHFGIMDVCGFPKNLYYYYQSWWTDKDVLHISPHWNWKGKEGAPIDVWVNSNADQVELFLNGKSLGKKSMPPNRHLQWLVNYYPGELTAVAYKGKRKFSEKIETTGDAYRIIATPSKTRLSANGKDAVVVNIRVVDKQGRTVPVANNMIQISLEANMKIIGVGNGDPSCHEPDKCSEGNWQRSLFNGYCQVIVQSTKNEGKAKFEARSNGLLTAIADFEIIKK